MARTRELGVTAPHEEHGEGSRPPDVGRGRRAAPERRDAIFRAAFRSCATGEVVDTGAHHDILLLPGGLEADLDEWQAGFLDASGRFLDRREAAAAVGRAGRLEARAWFSGDREPTLEAGHPESWRMLRAG